MVGVRQPKKENKRKKRAYVMERSWLWLIKLQMLMLQCLWQDVNRSCLDESTLTYTFQDQT